MSGKHYGNISVQELRRKFYVRRTWKLPAVVTQKQQPQQPKQQRKPNDDRSSKTKSRNNRNGNSLLLASRYNLLLQSVRLDRTSQGKTDVTAQYQASLTQLSNRHKQRPAAKAQRATVKPGVLTARVNASPSGPRATMQKSPAHTRNGSNNSVATRQRDTTRHQRNSAAAKPRPTQGERLKKKPQHGEGTLKKARERRVKVDDRKVNKRLVSVYVAQTRPDLLPNVDAMLKRYEGREAVLLRRLARGDIKQGLGGVDRRKTKTKDQSSKNEQDRKKNTQYSKHQSQTKYKRKSNKANLHKHTQKPNVKKARKPLPLPPKRTAARKVEDAIGGAIRTIFLSPVTWIYKRSQSDEEPSNNAYEAAAFKEQPPAQSVNPEELSAPAKPPKKIPKLPKQGYNTYPNREKRKTGGTDTSPVRWSGSMLSEGMVASGDAYEGWDVAPTFTLRRQKQQTNNPGYVNQISAPAGRDKDDSNNNNNSNYAATGNAFQAQYSLFDAGNVTTASEEYMPMLDSASLDVAVMREILYSFLAVYAPERIPRLDAELSIYSGREEDLFKLLENQFGVIFGADGYARVDLGIDGGGGNGTIGARGNGYNGGGGRNGWVDVTESDDNELEEGLVQFLKKRDGLMESMDTREKASNLLDRYTIGNLGRALMNMHHELPVGWSDKIAKRRQKKNMKKEMNFHDT